MINYYNIIGANLFFIFLMFYFNYFKALFVSSKRKKLNSLNQDIEKLRKIKIKSLEEQKQFIDLKYPKVIGKTKFNIMYFFNLLKSIIIFIVMYKLFFYIINYYNIIIPLYFSILMWIIFPFLINYILKKYNLHIDDTLFEIIKR